MPEFKTPAIAASAIVFALFAAGLLVSSRLNQPLLPASASAFPWAAVSSSDAIEGGRSQAWLNDASTRLDFSFRITDDFAYPYGSAGITFPAPYADWSRVKRLHLLVTCTPANELLLNLLSFDEQISSADDYNSFRPSTGSFHCNDTPTPLTFELDHLVTPEWWLLEVGRPVSDTGYDRSRIRGFTISNSRQSPIRVDSNVQVMEATLDGRDWRLAIVAGVMAACSCACVFLMLLRRQRRPVALEPPLQEPAGEQVALADSHQPVAATFKKDRDKRALLEFLATHYTDSEMSLELITSTLGINRIKVNDILREHCGLTFSSYLNQLRLSEAARLLCEEEGRVAEIGFQVGYNNPSYFNQLFKKTYGCTPKVFRQQGGKTASDAVSISAKKI